MSVPAYTVRESSRARGVRLVVRPREGLTVVVPRGFDQTQIRGLLERKRSWINRALGRVGLPPRLSTPSRIRRAPARLRLQAIGEDYRVSYRWATVPWELPPRPKDGELIVVGRVENPAACRAALSRWVRRKACDSLVPWLRRVSREMELPFQRAAVRNQRSLWASCSAARTISINQRLLFVPAALVRYVFVHELCHTVHLDHSAAFWSLVARHEPHWQVLERRLDAAWRRVPAW